MRNEGLAGLLVVLTALTALAGTRASLDVRAVPVSVEAPAVPPLDRIEPLGLGTLPAVAALDAVAGRLESPPVATYAALSVAEGIAPVRLPDVQPVAPGAVLSEPAYPAYAAFASLSALPLDVLVTHLDLWRAGPLGQLRVEARRAASAGDVERFEALKDRFWRQYNAAVERRAVFGKGE